MSLPNIEHPMAGPFDKAAVLALCPTVTPPERIRVDNVACARAVHAATGIMRQIERGERATRQLSLAAAMRRENERRAADRRAANLHQHNCTRLQNPFAGLTLL